MPRVLLTAFEPFGPYAENSSLLCLKAVEENSPPGIELSTRRYPVDFHSVRTLLARDLEGDFTVSLHLGQARGNHSIALEAFAINAGGYPGQDAGDFLVLEPQGPAAYRSPLPLPQWAQSLRDRGLPVEVSFHAGTYLCNATAYWAQHWWAMRGLSARSLFVHLPLADEQADAAEAIYRLPLATMVTAVQAVLTLLTESTNPGVAAAGLPR